MKILPKVLAALPFCQKCFGGGQTFARLFQKLIRFAVECFGDANQTGQRKIVFGAFNAADECPVHIGALGKRFLRQGHFFPVSAHVFRHPLAILVVHVRQFWTRKALKNIDVTSIAFNTRQPRRNLAKLACQFLWNPSTSGLLHRKTVRAARMELRTALLMQDRGASSNVSKMLQKKSWTRGICLLNRLSWSYNWRTKNEKTGFVHSDSVHLFCHHHDRALFNVGAIDD